MEIENKGGDKNGGGIGEGEVEEKNLVWGKFFSEKIPWGKKWTLRKPLGIALYDLGKKNASAKMINLENI